MSARTPRTVSSAALALACASALTMLTTSLTMSCKKDEPAEGRGAPPPPPPPAASSQPGACSSGGGQVNDPVSAPFFPRQVGSYCVDPQGETKTYGDRGKLSMDEVCTTAFDGECEVYKRFGLKRTVALRYVDGRGGAGSVEIYLNEFKDVSGGFAMFTKRVVADGDPADPQAPRPLSAGGAGAIGTGRAYVWKGPYLVELQYNNEQESPEQLAKSSELILTKLAKEIGDSIPAPSEPPASARALPDAQRLPNGVSFVPKDALGLSNVGPAAIGYYRDGGKRWRVIAMVRDDVERAKDEMKTVRGRPGALPVPGVGDEGSLVLLQEAKDRPRAEYVFARKGGLLVGVGDEELVLAAGADAAASRLSKDEKLVKLKAALAASPPAGAASVAPAASAAKKK